MKKIIQTTALVLIMTLPDLGHGREDGDARFELKETILKEIPRTKNVEKSSPTMKIIKKYKARKEVLRSNGRLERLYNFSVSL
jgi:hypothetical protein